MRLRSEQLRQCCRARKQPAASAPECVARFSTVPPFGRPSGSQAGDQCPRPSRECDLRWQSIEIWSTCAKFLPSCKRNAIAPITSLQAPFRAPKRTDGFWTRNPRFRGSEAFNREGTRSSSYSVVCLASPSPKTPEPLISSRRGPPPRAPAPCRAPCGTAARGATSRTPN